MAIWQFELAIVPAGKGALVWDRGGFDIEPVDPQYFHSLALFLETSIGGPRQAEYGTSTFGDLEGNRIDLLTNGLDTREVWTSIDARSDADMFCKLLCTIAVTLDCEFFAPEYYVRFAPTRNGLCSALRASRAWAYALDPSISGATEAGRRRG